jgi:hypothetical protein
VLLNFKALDNRYVTVSVLNKKYSQCGIVRLRILRFLYREHLYVLITALKGTITAKNGAFNLDNVPLDASITISYIGYESKQFTANELFSTEGICKKIF